jgi:putative nucleotidyltransferase with HDIG domain
MPRPICVKPNSPDATAQPRKTIAMNAIHAAAAPGSGIRNSRSSSTPATTARVLIVDDEAASRKMLATMLAQENISCQTAAGAEEALQILEEQPFDAVIADLQMPKVSGMQLLAEVRQRYPELAFLIGTGVDDVRVGVRAMREGADDYLVKPFESEIVMACLERAFQKKRLEREVENYRSHLEEMVAVQTQQLQGALRQIESSYESTLEALGAAIDLRDSPTAGHSRRVFLYSIEIAKALNLTEHQLTVIGFGALLHDIGKLAIPDSILLKPGPLTAEEKTVMQKHVQLGYGMIKGIEFLVEPAKIILTHHERCDGSGYPQGLKSADIPIGAKIFAVADTVDAMTSDRPYRAALPFLAAREQIKRGSGKEYDSRVAEVFLQISNEKWETIRTEARAIPVGQVVTNPAADSRDWVD